jgi:hypothetical protein
MLNPFVRRSTFILVLIYFYKLFFILRSDFLSRLYSAIFSLAYIHLSLCKTFWIFINLFIINIIYQAHPTMAIPWIIFHYYHFRIARYFIYFLLSAKSSSIFLVRTRSTLWPLCLSSKGYLGQNNSYMLYTYFVLLSLALEKNTRKIIHLSTTKIIIIINHD